MGVVSKGSKRSVRAERSLVAVREASSDEPWLGEATAPSGMLLARVLRHHGEEAVVEWRGRSYRTVRDAALAPSVLDGAVARGERVVIDVEGDRATIVGALRTQPTAGLEPVERFAVEANRVELRAAEILVEGDELVLSSKTAKIILRAASEIESFAERIVSRATGVQKIIGRMLRLN
jgi:hypothetical protein